MEQAVEFYLEKYEERMMHDLLKRLSEKGLLDNRVMLSDDITDVWTAVAPDYVADSVKEITKYPDVALGWAMYLGMAVAHFWDEDWMKYAAMDNIYLYLRDKRGYDYMDEVVRGEVLGLAGSAFDEMEETVRSCAAYAQSMIRHENIEPQSPMAFHVYARSIRVLYKLGAAMELKTLGYKVEKVKE